MNVASVFLAVNPQGTENVSQASGVYRLVTLHAQIIPDGAFCRAHITQTYGHGIFPSVSIVERYGPQEEFIVTQHLFAA